MWYAIYNNQIYKEEELYFSLHNRAMNYGDGIFETVRVCNGKLLWIDKHFNRLLHGMELLQFTQKDSFSFEKLKQDIQLLLSRNKVENARIKIILFRAGQGLYTSINNDFNYIITCKTLHESEYTLNQTTCKALFYDGFVYNYSTLNEIKRLSALPYVLCANYAKNNNAQEAFLMNENEEIIEAASSNIFIRKNNEIYSPPLYDGCLPGVMRSIIFYLCHKYKIKIHEKTLEKKHLLEADEIFLTNVIQGIKTVTDFYDKKMEKISAVRFTLLINEFKNELF